jgi:hypothetical protein
MIFRLATLLLFASTATFAHVIKVRETTQDNNLGAMTRVSTPEVVARRQTSREDIQRRATRTRPEKIKRSGVPGYVTLTVSYTEY